MNWGLLQWPDIGTPVASTRPDYIAALLEEFFGTDAPDQPGQLERLLYGLNLKVVLEKLPDGKVGQLREDRSNPMIVVDSEVTRRQWAFVVAHEIGHFIVNRLHQQSRPELRPGVLSAELLERVCDAIASDLLLPQRWLRARLAIDDDLSLESMHQRADGLDIARGTLMQALARAGAPIGWVRTAQYRSGAVHITSQLGEYVSEARRLAQGLQPSRAGYSSRDVGVVAGRRCVWDMLYSRRREDAFAEYLLRPAQNQRNLSQSAR